MSSEWKSGADPPTEEASKSGWRPNWIAVEPEDREIELLLGIPEEELLRRALEERDMHFSAARWALAYVSGTYRQLYRIVRLANVKLLVSAADPGSTAELLAGGLRQAAHNGAGRASADLVAEAIRPLHEPDVDAFRELRRVLTAEELIFWSPDAIVGSILLPMLEDAKNFETPARALSATTAAYSRLPPHRRVMCLVAKESHMSSTFVEQEYFLSHQELAELFRTEVQRLSKQLSKDRKMIAEQVGRAFDRSTRKEAISDSQ